MSLLDFHSILISCGKKADESMKLYRHASTKNSIDPYTRDIEEVIRMGDLEIFQSVQGSKQLGEGLVAFFMGEAGRLSRFLGVWRVDSIHGWQYDSPKAQLSRERGYLRGSGIWHELDHDTRFSEYENRLIVEWPETGRHHQWLVENGNEKRKLPVRELRPLGTAMPFPGFDQIIISYGQLVTLIENDVAGWREALSSTNGVYLITDKENGELYVGSATGENGLWGRWREYAKLGHGNNKIMIDRLQTVDAYSENLQFSILQTLGSLASRKDGISAEVRWKKKLGRKATILNGN